MEQQEVKDICGPAEVVDVHFDMTNYPVINQVVNGLVGDLETKTYACGLRFNPQVRDINVGPKQPYTGAFYSGNWTPHGPVQTPLQEFLAGNKRVETKDYELTEEEHKAFDSLEGCSPEEIEIAKKVLAKTIQVPVEPKVRWKPIRKVKGSGINSNSPLPTTEIQDRLDQLENTKQAIIASMQQGSMNVGQAIEVMNANSVEELKMAFDSDIFDKGDILTMDSTGEKWEVQ